jgi:hypothetical protein
MATVPTSLDPSSAGEPGFETEPLRCIDTDAAVLSTRHPFAAYKETNRASGAWRVRIHSRQAATAVLYPNAIRLQARAVSEQGKSFFTWSNSAIARSGNAEQLKFRVHVMAASRPRSRSSLAPCNRTHPPLPCQ